MKKMTIDVILHLDSRLTLHDFRIVQSQARINLIFDLVVPREYTKQMREELTRQVCERVRERDSAAPASSRWKTAISRKKMAAPETEKTVIFMQ